MSFAAPWALSQSQLEESAEWQFNCKRKAGLSSAYEAVKLTDDVKQRKQKSNETFKQ